MIPVDVSKQGETTRNKHQSVSRRASVAAYRCVSACPMTMPVTMARDQTQRCGAKGSGNCSHAHGSCLRTMPCLSRTVVRTSLVSAVVSASLSLEVCEMRAGWRLWRDCVVYHVSDQTVALALTAAASQQSSLAAEQPSVVHSLPLP